MKFGVCEKRLYAVPSSVNLTKNIERDSSEYRDLSSEYRDLSSEKRDANPCSKRETSLSRFLFQRTLVTRCSKRARNHLHCNTLPAQTKLHMKFTAK